MRTKNELENARLEIDVPLKRNSTFFKERARKLCEDKRNGKIPFRPSRFVCIFGMVNVPKGWDFV